MKNEISRLKFRSGNRQICIQCNICSLVCPHAAIRPKVYDPEFLDKAPEDFQVG